jgi:hypothetical protein
MLMSSIASAGVAEAAVHSLAHCSSSVSSSDGLRTSKMRFLPCRRERCITPLVRPESAVKVTKASVATRVSPKSQRAKMRRYPSRSSTHQCNAR